MAPFPYHGGKSTLLSVPYPKFIVLHSEDCKLNTVSPFLIAKAIEGIAGSVTSVKKLSSGDLLVCTASESQTKNLLKCKKLADIPITATPHPSLNKCKGVIYCPDIAELSKEEILNGLKEQNVEDIKQILVKKDGALVKSPLFILTFGTTTLPSKIMAGYISVNVRHYIPNPLRCFKCQVFGHGHTLCKNSPVCENCGSTEHTKDHCQEKPHCVNCSLDHPANSRECIKYKFEKEVQRIKVINNLSYPEARKQAEVLFPSKPKTTYAEMANKPSTSTQSFEKTIRPETVRKQPTNQSKETTVATNSNTSNITHLKSTTPPSSSKTEMPLNQWLPQVIGNLSNSQPSNQQIPQLLSKQKSTEIRRSLSNKRGQTEDLKQNTKMPKQTSTTDNPEDVMDLGENDDQNTEKCKERGRSLSRHRPIFPPS